MTPSVSVSSVGVATTKTPRGCQLYQTHTKAPFRTALLARYADGEDIRELATGSDQRLAAIVEPKRRARIEIHRIRRAQIVHHARPRRKRDRVARRDDCELPAEA